MSTSTSMRRNMSIKRSIQNHNLAYLFPIDFIFVFCSLEFLSYSYRCSSPPFFPHIILLITHTNIDRKQIEREVCCSPNPVLSQYSVWSRSPMNHLEWHTFWKMIILSFYICFSSLLPWNPLLWTEKLLLRATDKMEHTIVFNNPVHLFSLNFFMISQSQSKIHHRSSLFYHVYKLKKTITSRIKQFKKMRKQNIQLRYLTSIFSPKSF